MLKQYKILKWEMESKYVPNRISHNLVEVGFYNIYDTLEEAEETLAKIINEYDNYTIIPYYTYD